MSDAKHTPGPWTCRSPDDKTYADTEDQFGEWGFHLDNFEDGDGRSMAGIAIRGQDRVIAMAVVIDPDPFAEQRPAELDANARLMAAAPELLAACEAMAAAVGESGELNRFGGETLLEVRDMAAAAVAKARGAVT